MVEQGTFGNMKYGSTSHANKKRHKRRKKQTFPKMTKRKKIIITALPACERRFGTCAGPNADVRSASPMENGLSSFSDNPKAERCTVKQTSIHIVVITSFIISFIILLLLPLKLKSPFYPCSFFLNDTNVLPLSLCFRSC